jgi:hypothetical protein
MGRTYEISVPTFSIIIIANCKNKSSLSTDIFQIMLYLKQHER